MFVRKFSPIESLKQEPLFTKEYLLDDIEKGYLQGKRKRFVFPAVRNERIDFYLGGGKLFSYLKPPRDEKHRFVTNHKYASVLCGNKTDYISEPTLQGSEIRLIKDFREGYKRIKENCEKYSGDEALGVSSLYERFSCAQKEKLPVVILDIEASFASAENQESSLADDENNTSDRIDIVSLDTESGMIRFIEAKHYSNRDSLRSKSGEPKVIGQMKRYAGQIENENKQSGILEAYREHVKVINELFSAQIPEPKSIDPKPILLIFGFDAEQ
jgi:hypothetical protein